MITKQTNPSLPQREPKLAQIRKVSAGMGYVCLAIVCAIPLVPLLTLLFLFMGVVPGSFVAAQEPLAFWSLATIAVFKIPPVLFLMIGLWRARACFKRFARGDFFATSTARALREFSAWTAVSAIIALTGEGVFAALMYSLNFQQLLLIIAASGYWLAFLFAGTVWVMAAMIDYSRLLTEENESFV